MSSADPPARGRLQRLLLAIIVLAGVAIVALSLLPAWLLHVRNVGGHGLTAISVSWSAWEGRAWPFLPAGVALAGLLAFAAGTRLAGARRPSATWLFSIALGGLALLIGSVVPLERQGYASGVHLTARWGLLAAIGLATAAAVASGAMVRRRAWLVAGAGVLVLLSGASYGGRVVALNLAEGNPRHYADGTYVREATDGQPTETLVISNGTFTIGDRWSGSISGRGLVAVLTDDPACPDDRGAYRVFAAGGQDIRWNLVVDLCAGDARASDLTTGTWRRQP